MSRNKWGLKNPERFLFDMSPAVAMKFRAYCSQNQYIIGRVLEDLVVEHLIAEGVIESRVALTNEQVTTNELDSKFEKGGQTVTPASIQLGQHLAHAASVVEAAKKEAQEFNSKKVKTGKEASRLT